MRLEPVPGAGVVQKCAENLADLVIGMRSDAVSAKRGGIAARESGCAETKGAVIIRGVKTKKRAVR